jgi:hypothetical protein
LTLNVESAALGAHTGGVVAAAEQVRGLFKGVPAATMDGDRLVGESLVDDLAHTLVERRENHRTKQLLERCAS